MTVRPVDDLTLTNAVANSMGALDGISIEARSECTAGAVAGADGDELVDGAFSGGFESESEGM